MWQFTLVHGLLIGGGTSASFGPVIADISLWFAKRRGVAVAICSSGSYLAGTVWPLLIQPLAQWAGWRHTYFGIAVFCLCSMLPLLLALRWQGRGRNLRTRIAEKSRNTPARRCGSSESSHPRGDRLI